MSYTILKSDGTVLCTVPENDIVLDQASVALVGRGSQNYGTVHSENFVHILENFANTTAPAFPLNGQLWFDTSVNALKVYDSGTWGIIGGGGSGSGSGSGSGTNVGGNIFVQIGSTSVMAFVAGGVVVAAVSPQDIVVGLLPVSITVLGQTVPFQARFPNGLQGGITLASDSSDYIYEGHVPNADAAIWAGGGTPFAATTFCDLGANCVTLTISNNVIISAFSQAVVAANALPSTFTCNGISMQFASAFPNGLVAGLTFAGNYGIGVGGGTISGGGAGSGVTLSTVQTLVGQEATTRASAITALQAYGDSTYATASSLTTVTAEFESATGQSSLASAIQWLAATAGAGTSGADYSLALQAQITSAITGATSFASALQILNTAVTTQYATASQLTSLHTTITGETTTSIANATSGLVTTSTLNSAIAAAQTAVNTSFESSTGYSSVASAVNDLKATVTGNSSTAMQDTDLRTQLTNALAVGAPAGTVQTISQAMGQLSNFFTDITTNATNYQNLVAAIQALPGNNLQELMASAVQNLVSNSSLNSALATFSTSLTSQYIQAMNTVTGGTATTYGAAIADVVASASSTSSGSTSSIDTTLRNLMISTTSTQSAPVTTVAQALQTLMSGVTASQSNTSSISTLQSSVNNNTASLTAQSGTLATLSGRTSAFWSVTANSGSSATAFISANADTGGGVTTSSVSIGASEFSVFNPNTNGWTKALSITNGNVQIFGQLQAGSVTASMLAIGTPSGARVTISTNLITVIDSNGVTRVKLGVF